MLIKVQWSDNADNAHAWFDYEDIFDSKEDAERFVQGEKHEFRNKRRYRIIWIMAGFVISWVCYGGRSSQRIFGLIRQLSGIISNNCLETG